MMFLTLIEYWGPTIVISLACLALGFFLGRILTVIDEPSPIIIERVRECNHEIEIKKLKSELRHQIEQKNNALRVAGPRLDRIHELEQELAECQSKVKFGIR